MSWQYILTEHWNIIVWKCISQKVALTGNQLKQKSSVTKCQHAKRKHCGEVNGDHDTISVFQTVLWQETENKSCYDMLTNVIIPHCIKIQRSLYIGKIIRWNSVPHGTTLEGSGMHEEWPRGSSVHWHWSDGCCVTEHSGEFITYIEFVQQIHCLRCFGQEPQRPTLSASET